jgi:hypothetical protein
MIILYRRFMALRGTQDDSSQLRVIADEFLRGQILGYDDSYQLEKLGTCAFLYDGL